MQSIVLTRDLLVELARCDRAFIMTLFYHNLVDNVIADHGGFRTDTDEVQAIRHNMMLETDHIQKMIANSNFGKPVEVVNDGGDIFTKVSNTWSLINRNEPMVIVNGALQGSTGITSLPCISNFALMIVREDLKWEIYHLSTKSEGFMELDDRRKAVNDGLADAAPLMYVLAGEYADRIARFAVIGADKDYIIPYPDPVTREITVDPNEAMYCIDLMDAIRWPTANQLVTAMRNEIIPAMLEAGAIAEGDAIMLVDKNDPEGKEVLEAFAEYVTQTLNKEPMFEAVRMFVEDNLYNSYDVEYTATELAHALWNRYGTDFVKDINKYLGFQDETPLQMAERLLSEIDENPFWIPEPTVPRVGGSCCSTNPYPCPFQSYCNAREDPDSVYNFVPYYDADRFAKAGYSTMRNVLELSYDFDTFMAVLGKSKTAEITLRELRNYENHLRENRY